MWFPSIFPPYPSPGPACFPASSQGMKHKKMMWGMWQMWASKGCIRCVLVRHWGMKWAHGHETPGKEGRSKVPSQEHITAKASDGAISAVGGTGINHKIQLETTSGRHGEHYTQHGSSFLHSEDEIQGSVHAVQYFGATFRKRNCARFSALQTFPPAQVTAGVTLMPELFSAEVRSFLPF